MVLSRTLCRGRAAGGRQALTKARLPRKEGKAGNQEKMKNSGNEAKKYLKTNDITFFNDANYARFARKFAQIER